MKPDPKNDYLVPIYVNVTAESEEEAHRIVQEALLNGELGRLSYEAGEATPTGA